jgi:hypothetical protein
MDSWDGTAISHVGYNRYSPSGQEMVAPIRLLAGSLIQGIELEGCDSTTSGEVLFVLLRADTDGSYQLLSPLATTGATAALGCSYYYQDASTPHTVDAFNWTYYVAARTAASTYTSVTAMRVFYQLQVSPAPATATFGDVPTSHSQFRFVEALAASGITGGCGGGNFCPDNPLTRGQMAVFLSTALGLHYPN